MQGYKCSCNLLRRRRHRHAPGRHVAGSWVCLFPWSPSGQHYLLRPAQSLALPVPGMSGMITVNALLTGISGMILGRQQRLLIAQVRSLP